MKKIPTLFKRNHETDRLVRDEVTPGCEWVIDGEGIATVKHDGTCCMVRDGILYKRHTVKPGKAEPDCFEPATEPDPVTGKVEGWVPVGDGPEDLYHREAFGERGSVRRHLNADGTYELCGPKVQGNPEKLPVHMLIRHGSYILEIPDLSYDGIAGFLAANDIEGIVWHHPDGRMAKIKRRDFGLKR